MQQASGELHKLITALSPTIYKLQIASSKFRLTTAENYRERIYRRYMRRGKNTKYAYAETKSAGGMYDGVHFCLYPSVFISDLWRVNTSVESRYQWL